MRINSISIKTKCHVSTTLVINRSARCYSTSIREWRKTFEDYALHNKISVNDWYELDIKQIPNLDEKTFESKFKGSLYKALSQAFPEIEWHPWKFKHENVPFGFWSNPSNQRKFFDDLAKKLGIQTLDDWYGKLSRNLIVENGGRGLLNWTNSSPITALLSAYPNHNWILSNFNNVPQGYWKETDNHRKFFDYLGQQIGIKTLDDWYEMLSSNLILENGGRGLLKQYNDSPLDALMTAYPEHEWIPTKFNTVATGFWQQSANRKQFFDYLGKVMQVKNLDDWYDKLSVNVIKENGGMAMVNSMYNGSPIAALMDVYPEHNWSIWKFRCVPQGFWKDIDNQRKFFDSLGTQLGVQTLDDWYDKLSAVAIKEHGGRGLLERYNESPMAALMAVYPEHNWVSWKFHGVTIGWHSREIISQLLAELSEKLSIQTLDDWYRVDYQQLQQFGALTFITRNHGLYEILKNQYPHHPWDVNRFQQKGKKAQRWLAVTLKKMFPNEDIQEDYVHPKILLPSSNRPLQLDVFIPSKSLAFEYQGKQHFQEVGVFNPSRTYQQRDEEKRVLCTSNNIKLIEVPYWWNRTQESLQEMIK